MPKPDKQIIITGEQQADIDVVSLARVIVQFVRQRRLPDVNVKQPADKPATPRRGERT